MHVACLNGAPLGLIAGMLKAAGDEAPDLWTIADKCRRTPLATAACGHDDSSVHRLLVSLQPAACQCLSRGCRRWR